MDAEIEKAKEFILESGQAYMWPEEEWEVIGELMTDYHSHRLESRKLEFTKQEVDKMIADTETTSDVPLDYEAREMVYSMFKIIDRRLEVSEQEIEEMIQEYLDTFMIKATDGEKFTSLKIVEWCLSKLRDNGKTTG